MAGGGWTFWCGGATWTEVVDEVNLSSLLDAAEADAAAAFPIVELRGPDGTTCRIGLGRDVSFATFDTSPGPPYFVSRGNLDWDGELVFFYDGHWTDFEPEAAIPVETAKASLVELFRTGARPAIIDWDEV
ncbi:MAG TPA: Imm1 family immunity protein [Gaiellaceae bacterium]|nr:Imm1 family immunity protein [Gaiellaceae bacterium]